MRKLHKIYLALSVVITAIFLLVGVVYCTKSYERLWEIICGIDSSIKFYFCKIFEIENNTPVAVITPSEIIQSETSIIPLTADTFGLKCKTFLLYFSMALISSDILVWLEKK